MKTAEFDNQLKVGKGEKIAFFWVDVTRIILVLIQISWR